MTRMGPSFMKIWTCGSSPRSESRNAWTRIKNVNGASRLSNFWNFFGEIQVISWSDWWPWRKPGYIAMTRRQSNNQWSAAWRLTPPPKIIPSTKIRWKSSRIILLFIFQRAKLLTRSITHLLVQLKDILKEKRWGKVTKGVLFLHDNAPAHRALATQKKLAYMCFQCLDHPFSVRRGGHCCPGDLVGRTTFWIFFLSGLQKLEQ